MSAAGYITVKCAGGLWESEGRLVVEKVLGRMIWPEEEIRHKPGVPQWDNRLENLELWRNGRLARRTLERRPAKTRTPWKRLYQTQLKLRDELRLAFPTGAEVGMRLSEDQAALLERIRDDGN